MGAKPKFSSEIRSLAVIESTAEDLLGKHGIGIGFTQVVSKTQL